MSQSKQDLSQRILGYSVIAGAALAGGRDADAGVIYSGPLSTDFGVTNGSKDITMQGATAEMRLTGSSPMMGSSLRVVRAGDSFQMRNYTTNTDVVQPLASGANVGAATNTPNQTSGDFYDDSPVQGAWETVGETNCFGFSFKDEGSATTLYGWAEVKRLAGCEGSLLGWAYDDTGGAIQVGAGVPEPSTLALYALGAAGVAACRRRRKKQEKQA